MQHKHDIQQLVGNTLRWGVTIACITAFVGGILYLLHHGADPMPDYTRFSYDTAHPAAYTTLGGILGGLRAGTAVGWIQTGVLILILTPILRVALSLIDFVQDRDWLYALITAVVLAVIISNSLEGVV